MSLFPARTPEEAKFQYCNYGYDKDLYTSFDDCMARYGETTLGNGLTNSQKWAVLVVGTLSIWAILYLTNKKY